MDWPTFPESALQLIRAIRNNIEIPQTAHKPLWMQKRDAAWTRQFVEELTSIWLAYTAKIRWSIRNNLVLFPEYYQSPVFTGDNVHMLSYHISSFSRKSFISQQKVIVFIFVLAVWISADSWCCWRYPENSLYNLVIFSNLVL